MRDQQFGTEEAWTMLTKSISRFLGLAILGCLTASVAFGQDAAPPDAAEEQAAMAAVRQAYQGQLDKAKTADQKSALAEKLLDQAKKTPAGSAQQYAVLKFVREVAVEAGDVQTAFKAVDEMASRFAIDPVQAKSDLIVKFVQGKLPAEEQKEFVLGAIALAQQAVAADRYDAAERALDFASILVRESRDNSLLQKISPRQEELAELKAAYAIGAAMRKTLAEKPDDPTANLGVGTYEALWKGDFAAGLPKLAKGASGLASIAQQELAAGGSGEKLAAAADAWSSLAQSYDGIARRQIQLHARDLHKQAVAALPDGAAKLKVQRRLAETASVSPVLLTSKGPVTAGTFVREPSRRKDLLKKAKYESMLGAYTSDNKPLPMVWLSVPSGTNMLNDEIVKQIRAKIKKAGRIDYVASAKFDILRDGDYVIESTFDKIWIDGRAVKVPGGKAAMKLSAGSHEVRVQENQSRSSTLRIRKQDTGQEIPLWNYGGDLEQHVARLRAVDVSGWQPVEIKIVE